MESADRELIMRAIKTNTQLKKLYEEHCVLDREISRLERRNFLTAAEEIEEKRLKRKKLVGVDKMMALVAKHRPIAQQTA